MNNKLDLNTYFNNIDPEGKLFEKAIIFAKDNGVDINDNKELKQLYTKLNKRIIELADSLEKEELKSKEFNDNKNELVKLNEIFYGLVGLMIDNKIKKDDSNA